MYSSYTHCKQNIFTNQMLLDLWSWKHSHIFSPDSSDKNQISVTYKAVIMYNNNEMWIDGQNHVSNYTL